MKGHYELAHLMQIASLLPKVELGKSIHPYKKHYNNLSRAEKESLKKSGVEIKLNHTYQFTKETVSYVPHLANIKRLNKKSDGKALIDKYCMDMKDKALAAINKKISNS